MANKNAHLRPHCVDLSPSVFTGKNNADKDNSSSVDLIKKNRAARSPQPALPAGAIRRSTEPKARFGTNHIGKLSAAAVVIAGVVVWTSSSSEPFTPVADYIAQPTLRAVVSSPAFFFDDETDALERKKHLIVASESPEQHSSPETDTGTLLGSDVTATRQAPKIAMLTAPPELAVLDSSAAVLHSTGNEKTAPKSPVFQEAPRVEFVASDTNNATVITPGSTPAPETAKKIQSLPAPSTSNLPDNPATLASTDTESVPALEATTVAVGKPAPEAAISTDSIPTTTPTTGTRAISLEATVEEADADAAFALANPVSVADPSAISGTIESASDSADEPEPTTTMKKVVVKSGDTLSDILNRYGLKGNRLRSLFTNALVKEHLSGIEVGQVIDLTFDKNNELKGLTTRAGSNTRINIEGSGSGFEVSAIDLPVERREVVTAGRIEQSLYLAAEQANLKQSTIMELANIFQWELDFARDIRLDDKFSLLYEQLYREGEYIGDGNILAAEFKRGGKVYKAIRFTTDDGESGYYSPDGKSKRRTFMRHPVDVVRITSKFNPNRLHPVLHKIRAHRGVDYGSPHGSPIYATADGRVIFSGAKNAYGNTVILKHGEKFSTLYAHMSKISKKSKEGQTVKQGDVIGYVGKTGRVTGTHLHYEFRVNGKQIDPLKVELPSAAPIDAKYLARLQKISKEVSVKMAQALEKLDNRVALTTGDLENPATQGSQ